jgi:hypothetical protein
LNDVFDPYQRWRKPAGMREGSRNDARLHGPVEVADGNQTALYGGGRRMTHPFLDPIVYPELPHQTFGFGYDILPRSRALVTKTLDSTAVSHFTENPEDVILREIWNAQQLSTETGLFHAFYTYLMTELPTGQYLGWRPTDLSPKVYHIDLLDVTAGTSVNEYLVEERGDRKPWMLSTALSVSFKIIREIEDPAGISVMEGL